jgi:hypothetical protein
MALRVTVEDIESGQKDERVVQDGDYILVTAEPCYLDGLQAYTKTHVLTVKGLKKAPVRISMHTDAPENGDATD